MSELSVVLKQIVSAIGLSAADEANLHTEIDNLVPTALDVALGTETPAEGIQTGVVPLLTNLFASAEQRLVQYVENRISGVPAGAAMPPAATLTAPADPTLVPTAPSQAELTATVGQPVAGVAAPVVPVPMVDPEVEAPVVATAPLVAAPVEDPTLASASNADFLAAGFKFNPNTGAALT